MRIETFQEQYPTTATVLGRQWLCRATSWPAPDNRQEEALDWYKPCFDQLERDLALLETVVSPEETRRAYAPLLREPSGLIGACYEVHGAAVLASVAENVRLHVPTGDGSGRNFDVRAIIQGHVINAECKVRDDDLIQPRFMVKAPTGLTGYARTRATIDPHDVPALQGRSERHPTDRNYDPIPEGTVIRQRLLDALAQLPDQGTSIVIWGHKQGDRDDLERALVGAEVCIFHRNHITKEVWSEWVRAGSGAFLPDETGEPFRGLNGILWIRLTSIGGSVKKAYKLYINSSAARELPEAVKTVIEDRLGSLSDEAK